MQGLIKPNGHDRNFSRLLMALEGFRARHRRWLQRVRMEQGYIDGCRTLLTDEGYQQLISKLELVPDSIDGIRAEDDRGASFTYGVDRNSRIHQDVGAGTWLGRPQIKPCDDDPF